MFLGVWIINLVVVSWNIYAIGNTWVEARHSGGWMRFVVWAGAFMTALGLTWNLIIVEAYLASMLSWLTPTEVEVLLDLGYLLVVPGILLGVTQLLSILGQGATVPG